MRIETIFLLFIILLFEVSSIEARYERVGFISDPIKLLLQDSYSSLKNRMYSQSSWKNPTGFRQVRKRKYTAFPPTFYSNYGFGPIQFNSRRSAVIPYSDLLFSGK
ncbi:unnamed protein product [Caenorhabditis bovis]|uniref:Uncharacterized protein n=1 Tax=Caenorhabditis bovis TaxID=2654633 RepID=A0A8S1F390_9PELO|nr:unnamed protein product [Caenorhabditis bovis]